MTTRKMLLRTGACAAALLLGGCATPGPSHLYTLSTAPDGAVIHDIGGAAPATIPGFVRAGETVTGLAYDPFTDHLFLRLAPGNVFRVIDRPDRSIKREFTAPQVPTTGGGDLAIRSRDRHLFLVHPTEPSLIEITPRGVWVRTVRLENLLSPCSGLAYDQAQNRFLVTQAGNPAAIFIYTMDGRLHSTLPLGRDIRSQALAYDANTRELYAVLASDGEIGVFDSNGRLLRTLPNPGPGAPLGIDTGPRSFLRMF